MQEQGFRLTDVQCKLRPEIAAVRRKSRSKACNKLPVISSVSPESISLTSSSVKKSRPDVYIASLLVT